MPREATAAVEDLMRELARPPEVELDAFHAHLERCERCRSHPFNLCTDGRVLLARAAVVAS